MSHFVPSIQPMYFLFVSHQSDQPFLRYGQNSVWPWNTDIFRRICQNNSFNRMSSKSNQVITMARATKLPRFVVIRWVILTISRRKAFWMKLIHVSKMGLRLCFIRCVPWICTRICCILFVCGYIIVSRYIYPYSTGWFNHARTLAWFSCTSDVTMRTNKEPQHTKAE